MPRQTTAETATTAELLVRARGGDRQALDDLFARIMPPLKRWAGGRLPAWARGMLDTDDLVQETVMRTFGRIDVFEYNEDSGLIAYLRQAVMNRIRNELRRTIRNPPPSPLDSNVEDDASSPLEMLVGKEAVDAYEAALQQLDAADRDLIIGRVELGFTFAELAAASGRPSADATRMAVGRALVRLAAHLRPDALPSPSVRNRSRGVTG